MFGWGRRRGKGECDRWERRPGREGVEEAGVKLFAQGMASACRPPGRTAGGRQGRGSKGGWVGGAPPASSDMGCEVFGEARTSHSQTGSVVGTFSICPVCPVPNIRPAALNQLGLVQWPAGRGSNRQTQSSRCQWGVPIRLPETVEAAEGESARRRAASKGQYLRFISPDGGNLQRRVLVKNSRAHRGRSGFSSGCCCIGGGGWVHQRRRRGGRAAARGRA